MGRTLEWLEMNTQDNEMNTTVYNHAIVIVFFASASYVILFSRLCTCCFCLGAVELGFLGSCFSIGRRNSWRFMPGIEEKLVHILRKT